MGVSKLFTYIKTHPDCVEHVDLVQLAVNRPGGINLLADFYSWEYFIQSRFQTSLDQKTNNPYLLLYGGEYKLISDYITSFVEALRNVNIELIFFLDGAKGSSDEGAARKWDTWMKRQARDAATMKKTLKILSGQTPFKAFDSRNITRPCLREVQNITTLLQIGCTIHTVLSGEADTAIAKHLLQDENTVAVFTNDTDFCIFPNSVFLSDCYFDEMNDLEMVGPSLTVKTPTKLICGLIKSERIWRHFQFPNAECLCELAIIAGNDFTMPVLSQIDELGGDVGNISKVAGLVRQFGTVENYPSFLHSMMGCPDLQRAVQHSRDFYFLSLPDDKDVQKNDETKSIISEAIQDIRYPGTIFSMYKRFYWHRMILDDSRQSNNTAECAMVYLRSHVYSILLPPDQDTVMEYGLTPTSDVQELVAHKVKKANLPSLPVVQKNSFTKNRILFHLIMSHQELAEPIFNNTYFHQYGNKVGFTCYVLRYFLLLNWEQNLHISGGEFLLLCAWMLGYHDPENYLYTHIMPTKRCITIESWLLCLFRTAHAFVGTVLNLTKEFPVPADLFSGAVWVNLYTASYLSPKNQKRHSQECPYLPREQIRSVNNSVKSILNERKHIIENIIKGLFPIRI